MVKELGRSKQFEIVDTVGPGTLLIRAAMLDIVSNVPPNVGRLANVHLSSMGEATFVFELIDAETGVIQARTADRRYIQPPSAMNTVSAAPTNSATALELRRDVGPGPGHDPAQGTRQGGEKGRKEIVEYKLGSNYRRPPDPSGAAVFFSSSSAGAGFLRSSTSLRAAARSSTRSTLRMPHRRV